MSDEARAIDRGGAGWSSRKGGAPEAGWGPLQGLLLRGIGGEPEQITGALHKLIAVQQDVKPGQIPSKQVLN